MRHWFLVAFLFQTASTHVVGVRNPGDVAWWRPGWRGQGPDAWQRSSSSTQWSSHLSGTPQPSPYKSGPPPSTSSQYRSTPPPSSYTAPSPTSSRTQSTPTSTMAPTPAQTLQNNYRFNVLKQHNLHRANHSAVDIAWDKDLAQIATQIADSCYFAHNVTAGGGGYGQNIAAGTTPINVAQIITNEFYNNEEPWFNGLYGLANPPMTNFEHWGHFSQVVWNSSTTVGCATVHCPNGVKPLGSDVLPYFTVCNYKPPGNFGGQYGKNIGKPLGRPTVTIAPSKKGN